MSRRGGTACCRFLAGDGRGPQVPALPGGQTHAAYSLDFKPCSMAFSGDGKTLVLGGEDGIVHLWDMARKAERFPPKGHTGPVTCLEFSPDCRTLATGAQDSTVRLWDLTGPAGKETANWQAQTDHIAALAFSPDGKKLATAAVGDYQRDIFQRENDVHLWGLTGESPRSLCVWEPHNSGTSSLAFHPDGRQLVTAGTDHMDDFSEGYHASVRFWDVTGPAPTKGTEFRFLDQDDDGKPLLNQGAQHLAFGPRGRSLVFSTGGTGAASVRLYDWDGEKYKERDSVSPLFVPTHRVGFFARRRDAGGGRDGPA